MPRGRVIPVPSAVRAERGSVRRSPGARASGTAVDGRERILAAAITAFSELGYAGTTTAAIARAAGVTQPLVHHHFGSKDGLWRAAMESVFSRVTRVVTSPATDAATAREALLGVIDRFVRFVAEHPEATRIIAREGAAPSPRLEHLLKHYLHEPFREVVDIVRAGQASGVITSEVRAEFVLFLVLGAGSHLFDVSALAERSQGIDTTSAWTRETLAASLRTLVTRGLLTETR